MQTTILVGRSQTLSLSVSLSLSLTHTQVKGIRGPNRDLIGTLINIDEGDGIVKLDADSALKIISLDILGKYIQKQY